MYEYTELENAKYMALKQITERWSKNLTTEERWTLYRYLIEELQKMLPEESVVRKPVGDLDRIAKALAYSHECCGGCID